MPDLPDLMTFIADIVVTDLSLLFAAALFELST
jgi:hypothetical protein